MKTLVEQMSIDLRFFASLRESLGASARFAVPEPAAAEPLRVADVRDGLIARGEPYASALARTRAVRCALNKALCSEDAVVQAGDELAFFPPVTGG